MLWSTAPIVNAASGVLMLALGLTVARMRPCTAVSRAFGVFTSFFGLALVAKNI